MSSTIRRIISVVPLQSPVVFNPFNLRVNGDKSLCKLALNSESVDAIQSLASNEASSSSILCHGTLCFSASLIF